MVVVLISRMARPNSPSAGRPLVTLLMMLLMVLGGPLMVRSPSAGRPLVTLLMMLLMVLGGPLMVRSPSAGRPLVTLLMWDGRQSSRLAPTAGYVDR